MIVSNMNDFICAYRKHFGKTVVKHEICSIQSSIHWRNVRINIANSSGEINNLIFNNAIRAYRKYFQKVVETWNMQNKLLYSLAQTTHKYYL